MKTIVEEEQKSASFVTRNMFGHMYEKYRIIGENLLADEEVVQAFSNGDRNRLAELTIPVFERLQQENPFLQIMHFHTPQTHSFLRVHKPEKYGDNLNDARPIIVRTNLDRTVQTGVEVGKYGIFYRIAFPVIDAGRHLGAFELGIDIRYVLKMLNQEGDFIPLLMLENRYLQLLFKHHERVTNEYRALNGNYALIRNELQEHNWSMLAELVNVDVLRHEYTFVEEHGTDHLLFIGTDIANFEGNTIGHILLVKDFDFYSDVISPVRWIYILSAIFLVIVIMILFSYILSKYSGRFKEYEERLLKARAKLQNVIDGSKLGYWEWDVQNHGFDINVRCLEILGESDERSVFHDSILTERIHPDDWQEAMTLVARAMNKAKPFNIDLRMHHNDGYYTWVELSGAVIERSADGDVMRMSGTMKDITDRKNLELENMKNSEYLNTLFMNSPNIVVVTDSEQLLDANRKFFETFRQFADVDAFKAKHDCICELFEPCHETACLHPNKREWIHEVLESGSRLAVIQN
ncbi:MAG: cache domain-containing protein, partial [Sulfurimonadaceae bacterium]|nr:cache domain-containing protein [Sulfurimonadaceae bacterium]